ncbi:MAG: hypothetical protein ACTSUF_08020 [Candidatus Heimdallarchaeaceae archaeon]
MGLLDNSYEARKGYFDCLIDLCSNTPEEDINKAIKFFEETENFEYLYGVKLAMDDFPIRLKQYENEIEQDE